MVSWNASRPCSRPRATAGDDWVVEPKLDGLGAIDDGVRIRTRRGTDIITGALPELGSLGPGTPTVSADGVN